MYKGFKMILKDFDYRIWSDSYCKNNECPCGGYVKNEVQKHQLLVDANAQNSIIELWTGLKDKNGIPIYENDILRINGKKHFNIFYVEYSKIKCGYNAIFNPRLEVSFDLSFLHCYGGDFEIIGNIHENPELLENNQILKENNE